MITTVRLSVFVLISLWGVAEAQLNSSVRSVLTTIGDVRDENAPRYLHVERNVYLLEQSQNIPFQIPDKSGIVLLRRFSSSEVFVQATQAVLKQYGLFEHASPVNHLWKINSTLLFDNRDVSKRFIVKSAIPDKLGKSLRNEGKIKVVAVGKMFLIIEGSLELILENVIPLDDVTYVGCENLTPKAESRVLDLNLGPNVVNKVHHEFPELSGEGMTLSLKELLYDKNDLDLQGRDQPSSLNAEESDNHATDMATIAAGAGNSFITGRGVGREAQLTSSDFSNLFPDDDVYFGQLDTWIQNHSYGTDIENFYGLLAEAYDESANRNPNVLHVFSSGNDGLIASTTGPYQNITGFANLTGNFKHSKNTLSVGAVDTTGNPVPFGSRGPSFDGRVKPEVVAYSTAGTSNSAALVSGVALLLQQAYKEKTGNTPPSSLVKALLINSAEDVAAPGIDYVTGFGNINAHRAIVSLQGDQFHEGVVGQGQTKKIQISLAQDVANLKITLVWNDPAATVNSSLALINDLDLELSANGNTWLPWKLNEQPTGLQQPATRSKDRLNNVEQISISAAEAGTYEISIEGFSVGATSQTYHVVWQWDEVNQFVWEYPTGSDNMPYNGETTSYFYWNSTLSNATGRLEYSSDDGTTWEIIKSNVDLAKGYYRWLVDPQLDTKVIARMVVGDESYLTDYFTVSVPLTMQTGFNCEDSVMLQWTRKHQASSYRVYTYGSPFLQPSFITIDTFFIFKKADYASPYFAVEPLLEDNTPLLRGPTVDYRSLGTACFIASLLDQVTDDGINLTLELGTTYGVSEVFFEREDEGGFKVIGSITPQAPNRVIQFFDDTPVQGFNRYRARLTLVNGGEVYSQTLEVFFISESPFFIFPNPVSASQELQIFSRDSDNPEFSFKLYKSDGALMMDVNLFSDREFVDMSQLNPGIYFYEISTVEGKYRGKILRKD